MKITKIRFRYRDPNNEELNDFEGEPVMRVDFEEGRWAEVSMEDLKFMLVYGEGIVCLPISNLEDHLPPIRLEATAERPEIVLHPASDDPTLLAAAADFSGQVLLGGAFAAGTLEEYEIIGQVRYRA